MAATYSYVLNGDTGLVAREKINNGFQSVIDEIEIIDNKTPLTLVDGATVSWNYTSGYNAYISVTSVRSLSITGATAGDYGTLVVNIGATGAGLSFGANDKLPGATYSFSSFNKNDVYGFYYDGTNYYWTYNLNY